MDFNWTGTTIKYFRNQSSTLGNILKIFPVNILLKWEIIIYYFTEAGTVGAKIIMGLGNGYIN